MRQLQLFTSADLAKMRDRTARRNYSPEAEEFRRVHKKDRDWGLARRHAEKLSRLRAAAADRAKHAAGTTGPARRSTSPRPQPAETSPATRPKKSPDQPKRPSPRWRPEPQPEVPAPQTDNTKVTPTAPHNRGRVEDDGQVDGDQFKGHVDDRASERDVERAKRHSAPVKASGRNSEVASLLKSYFRASRSVFVARTLNVVVGLQSHIRATGTANLLSVGVHLICPIFRTCWARVEAEALSVSGRPAGCSPDLLGVASPGNARPGAVLSRPAVLGPVPPRPDLSRPASLGPATCCPAPHGCARPDLPPGVELFWRNAAPSRASPPSPGLPARLCSVRPVPGVAPVGRNSASPWAGPALCGRARGRHRPWKAGARGGVRR